MKLNGEERVWRSLLVVRAQRLRANSWHMQGVANQRRSSAVERCRRTCRLNDRICFGCLKGNLLRSDRRAAGKQLRRLTIVLQCAYQRACRRDKVHNADVRIHVESACETCLWQRDLQRTRRSGQSARTDGSGAYIHATGVEQLPVP